MTYWHISENLNLIKDDCLTFKILDNLVEGEDVQFL